MQAMLMPCSPSASLQVFTQDELEFIAGLCIKHDIIALCDEVYEHLVGVSLLALGAQCRIHGVPWFQGALVAKRGWQVI